MEWSEYSFIIKESSLGGVGVFATQNIPAGTLLSRSCEVRTMKIKEVPSDFIKYCIFINDDECIGPERFDRMEIGWYINHSSTPNIAKISEAKKTDLANNIIKNVFESVTNIKIGDEILMDYNCLNEPEHMKENYFKIPRDGY